MADATGPMRRRAAKRAVGSGREETADGAVSPKRNVNELARRRARLRNHRRPLSARFAPAERGEPAGALRRVAADAARGVPRARGQGPDRLAAEGRHDGAAEGRLAHARRRFPRLAHAGRADRSVRQRRAAAQAHFRAAGGRARRRVARRSVAGADRGGLRRHGGAQIGRRRADRRRRALPQGNPPGERQPAARRARQPDRDGAGGHVQDGLAQLGDQRRPPPPAPRRDAGDRRPASRGGARGDGQAAAGIGRRRAPRARRRPRQCPQLPPEPTRA